ncbi:DUF4166 domain-containing protein [Jeotgalibacillus sp. ET6]|uniref:DUF4166 domain-containing protein n=1 Tax=Jeotgalibacillus sp. ET6 TaxID=3037260 RepID=UPI0024189312|nr:DUF4166 domain-containing protein [Jeotgalibacillus sp. ET6]MDG5472912.1 DUF4166 domain-containing protein [Jeotgalibacillus sp. ET6]
MKSIYEKVLGEEFKRLHPVLQKKFGIHSQSSYAVRGKGEMEVIQGGSRLIRLLSWMGVPFKLTFPERGACIPFTILNEAYRNADGKECVSWKRNFFFTEAVRSFDAVMKEGETAFLIQDDFGKGGFLTTTLTFQVTKEGGLLIHSENTALQIGSKTILLPKQLGIKATVLEDYNVDKDLIRIHVHLYQPRFGTVLMYKGNVQTDFPEKERGSR